MTDTNSETPQLRTRNKIANAAKTFGKESGKALYESGSENRIVYGIIGVLCIGLITLGIFYAILQNSKCSTNKYQAWPNSKKDRAFSIKLQDNNPDTNRCLQPNPIAKNDLLLNDTNLILNNDCDEDHIRFKILNERLLKQHGNLNDICLKTKDVSGRIEIVYDKDCTDKGKYIYKDSKIIYENDNYKDANGKCLKIDSNDILSKVTLQNCENATNFDLI